MKKVFILAAKKIVLSTSLILAPISPSFGGIPVIDGTNLSQNILSTIEAVAQTAKQIQQYQTQLQQYENMLQNTLAPAAFIWDRASYTMNQMVEATNTLRYYQNQLGSLDAYLGKFHNVAYYRSSPCFNGSGGCTPTEKALLEETLLLSSRSQHEANQAVITGVNLQFDSLARDAENLESLQLQAQGADGQLAAIQYANQFASNQANQLLQIRSLMAAQYNAVATKMQADADRDARQEAARAKLFDFGSPTDRSQNRGF